MTNITDDLQQLVQKIPSLDGIRSVNIENVGSSEYPSYYLLYRKNARIVRPPQVANNDLQSTGAVVNNLRMTDDRLAIDNGGIELGIYIADSDSPFITKMGGAYYGLLKMQGKEKICLVYHVYLNLPDPDLEKAIKDVVEKQVSQLKKRLQDILGVDPVAEKARAYAPVMTNILSELQGLAQQYPVFSNIVSATIENKGTNYVYQHLRYWENAHDVTTNDFLPYQAPPPTDRPVVEKGGIALDVYIRNVDEPFGFRNNNTGNLISPDRKIQLDYDLYFNSHDEFYDSRTNVLVIDKAVRNLMANQCHILRIKLNDIVDF